MKSQKILIIIFLIIVVTGCIKPGIDYNDFEWIYYDNKSMRFGKYSLEGSNCEYFVIKNNSFINIKSPCTERCVVLNELGEVVDTCIDIDTSKLLRMKRIETSKKFVNRFMISMTDTSKISNFQYSSFPEGNLNLLTREIPKRKRIIEFKMNGKEYSFELRDIYLVNEIYQFDSIHFLISIRSNFPEISPGRSNNYVIMLDLEKMTKRRLFGVILG